MGQVPPYRTFLASDADIRELLRDCRTIAMVGIDEDMDGAAAVARGMRAFGYRVVAIHPSLESWLDGPVHRSLEEMLEPVDIVDVHGDPERVPEHAAQAREAGARVLWMEKGVVNARAAYAAHKSGLRVVMNRSLIDEYEMHFPDDETGYDG